MAVRRLTFRPSLAQTKRAVQRTMDLYAHCSDKPRFDVVAPAVRPARQPAQSPKLRPQADEGEVKKAVLQYLRLCPQVVSAYLINGGTAYDANGQPVPFYRPVKGPRVLPDIIGHLVGGRPYAIELKREGWKMAGPDAVYDGAVRERAQLEYIEFIRSRGGVAGFARSVDEARAIIEGTA